MSTTIFSTRHLIIFTYLKGEKSVNTNIVCKIPYKFIPDNELSNNNDDNNYNNLLKKIKTTEKKNTIIQQENET